MKPISDWFILIDSSFKVISIISDSRKGEEYIVNLNIINDKNDLHHTIKIIIYENISFFNIFIYTNIDKVR